MHSHSQVVATDSTYAPFTRATRVDPAVDPRYPILACRELKTLSRLQVGLSVCAMAHFVIPAVVTLTLFVVPSQLGLAIPATGAGYAFLSTSIGLITYHSYLLIRAGRLMGKSRLVVSLWVLLSLNTFFAILILIGVSTHAANVFKRNGFWPGWLGVSVGEIEQAFESGGPTIKNVDTARSVGASAGT